MNWLETFVGHMINAFEGILSFFQWIVPLLCKMAFVASPFLFGIYIGYRTWGAKGAIIGSVIVVALALLGMAFTPFGGKTNTMLSAKAVAGVIGLHIMLLIFFPLVNSDVIYSPWRANRQAVIQEPELPPPIPTPTMQTWEQKLPEKLPPVQPPKQTLDPAKQKESAALDMLADAITVDPKDQWEPDVERTQRAIAQVLEINLQAAVPLLIDALEKYYPTADRWTQSRDTSLACINALVALRAKQACTVFYQIRVKSKSLSEASQKAEGEVCRK